jgi:hypothetical protein
LLPKDLEIQILKKNHFFQILTSIKRNVLNKTKLIPIFFLCFLLQFFYYPWDGDKMVGVDSIQNCSLWFNVIKAKRNAINQFIQFLFLLCTTLHFIVGIFYFFCYIMCNWSFLSSHISWCVQFWILFIVDDIGCFMWFTTWCSN